MFKQLRMLIRRIPDIELLKMRDLINEELERRGENLEKTNFKKA